MIDPRMVLEPLSQIRELSKFDNIESLSVQKSPLPKIIQLVCIEVSMSNKLRKRKI